ncbi:MAG: Asp-tRNA(Asn)/Glu-tRNA(Gln) amidotransferase subunit GatC [Acidobacteriaceae bacterium]|nr:Asp-tRNA(Asn)/Glu-tRNA(Gln) amidotransferase subunit GatC [Acidobacteriaceae bacterium]
MVENERVAAPVAEHDVRRVAELANVELTDAEISRMQRDLNAILDYVAQLNEVDTSVVEPMAQVSDVFGEEAESSASALREDRITPCLDRQRVMAAAPDTDGVFFKVPKVIER